MVLYLFQNSIWRYVQQKYTELRYKNPHSHNKNSNSKKIRNLIPHLCSPAKLASQCFLTSRQVHKGYSIPACCKMFSSIFTESTEGPPFMIERPSKLAAWRLKIITFFKAKFMQIILNRDFLSLVEAKKVKFAWKIFKSN